MQVGKAGKCAVSYLNKPVLSITARDAAVMLNEAAIVSKRVANNLLNMGMKDEVTPKFVRQNYPYTFNSSGRFTKKVRNNIINSLEENGLSTKITFKEYLKAFISQFNI